MTVTYRLQKLRQRLGDEELDATLISQAENRRYLSGFDGSAGILLISQESAILATDFRYIEQAKMQSPDFEVVRVKGELADWFPELALELGVRRIGFEGNHISVAAYHQLTEALDKKRHQGRIQLISTEGVVESLRAIKEPGEIELITQAVELANAALDHAKAIIQPGMREKEVAWELERFLREQGSEPLPFDLIVASGPNSALPHAKPSERTISPGEPVVIDIGGRLGGYCSDMSRTIYLGNEDKVFKKIYDVVLGAQLTAIATLEAGMSGDQSDRLARMVIEQAEYGEAFGHGLGHGIGLAAHEGPRLGPGSSDIIADGMVFTIEPGIYLAGWGGVRIEDVVVVEKGRPRMIAKSGN